MVLLAISSLQSMPPSVELLPQILPWGASSLCIEAIREIRRLIMVPPWFPVSLVVYAPLLVHSVWPSSAPSSLSTLASLAAVD